MKYFKYAAGLALASVVSISLLTSAQVYANTESSTGNKKLSQAQTAEPIEVQSNISEVSNETTVDASQTATESDSIRDQAKKQLAEARQKNKTTRTVAAKQKACQAREKNLNNKIANYSKLADRKLEFYDTTFAKLQAYQTNKNLTVPEYGALVSTATAKQMAASVAVAALKDVSVEIDCSTTDPASAVATVKAAVVNARTALKEYRTAIKNVLVVLMTAKNGDDNSDTTSKPTESVESETVKESN